MTALRFAGVIAYRPAAAAAVLLIVGIALHHVFPVHPLAWTCISASLLVAACLTWRKPILCSALVGTTTLFTGCASAQIAYWYFPTNDISAFAGDARELAWVEGRIEESPRSIESTARGRPLPDKQTFQVRVQSVLTWKGWVPASGELPVSASPPRQDLLAGQIIRLLGRLERPTPAMNPGGFDSAQYYRRQRILVTMRISRPYDVQIISGPKRWAWVGKIREKSRVLLDRGFTTGRSIDRATLRALVFGDREPALHPVEDDFSATGTTHLLAANGARVAMLAALIYFACRLMQFSPRRTVAVATLGVIGFGLLSMPVAQSIRPVILCAGVGLGLFSRRVTDSIQLLSLAAITLLVSRPMDLYSAGFQLSFVIVLALIILTRPLTEFIFSLENEDDRVARSFLPRTRWRLRRERLGHWAIEFVVAALIGWIAAIPLVALHFEQFNLWTLPFTLLLSPFALLALVAGFAKLILTAIFPALATSWATLALGPASMLRHVVAFFAKVPGADLPVGAPALWLTLFFYATLCAPLIALSSRRIRICARCAPLCGFTALLLLPIWSRHLFSAPAIAGLKVTVLDVGAGQCAVVESGGGQTIIFDAGSSTLSDPYRSCISPFLRHEGCASVDELWLSHGDFDHIGASGQLVAGYGVKEILASPHLRRLAHESKPCLNLLETLDRTHHSPRQVIAGDHISAGAAKIEVLWPPAQSNFNTNNTGVVLRLTCAGRSILFPADIQDLAERELLKHPDQLRADILIAPHHGSGERTTPEFVAAVHPRAIISSNDVTLSMKQRLFDQEVHELPSFRTSTYGAITLEVTPMGTIRISSFRKGRLMEISE